MGFFKKIFGTSTKKETTNNNNNENEDNVPQNNIYSNSDKPTSKQQNNPKMICWENFFGVNLKTAPNEEWEECERYNNGENTIRDFINFNIENEYFSSAEAKVIGDSSTNFFFKCPYNWNDAFDIYFLIERDLVHHGSYTNTVAANKFRGKFDSLYDSFEWRIDNCSIRLSRDIDTGDIELGIWTLFYNEEFLGKPKELSKQDSFDCEEPNFFEDIFVNDKISWENFFGVNLKTAPNEEWEECECYNNGKNTIRDFINFNIENDYFSSAEAKVIGDSSTNFFFKCPYNWDDAFDIYYLIERDLVHGGVYTNTEAANKFRNNFDSYYDSFDWDIDGCHMSLSRDINNGDIELSIWTSFYNKEYLDTLQEEEHNQIQENDINDISSPQQNFSICLSCGLETLNFVHQYLEEQLVGTAPYYIVQSKGDTIQLLDEDSYSEVFSFQSIEISNYLNGRLGALGFTNFNCDDMTKIQAEVFVIPAGDSTDCKVKHDALVYYEMDYLVDPIDIDYRRKTIMDRTMNLNIVGSQHYNSYDKLVKKLKKGMTVILKAEPTNKFDHNALAFYYNDEIIGYLPKKDQPFVRIFMANGQIEATICNIDEKWIDTEISITKDMIDFNAYEKTGVHFTKIESFKGGSTNIKSIELLEFAETI